MNTVTRKIIDTGLWNNNPALVQLLGLCPLLAVSNSLINGLGLGIATVVVLCASNLVVSLSRNFLRDEIRIPVFVLLIASLVTVIELVMNAWFHSLFRVLGIFVPLIVTNCAIIGRAEAFASRNRPLPSLLDGLAMGGGFAATLVVLGAARELIGRGSLLDGADLLFGDIASNWTIQFFAPEHGFLLALLPPGAFMGLGMLVALKNALDHRRARLAALAPSDDAVSERA
ncbi:MAG: electron transport complex subunit E [Proteobacteria bacterium]|nr:electron transport complex subunit E [Pseudomonadota bacterium]MCH8221192.1 electron transport complex subunit E [Pseudomonadota bacterium]